MRRMWCWLQSRRWWFRWPIKLLVMGLVVFAVLYPDPVLFVRHLRHIRHMDAMANPGAPALAPVAREFEAMLAARGIDPATPDARILSAVQDFVYARVPYAWDWNTWGVVDYLPTVSEVIARGREDCDGRAVLAVALLRRLGLESTLVGDPRHVWVETGLGATMNPLGEPTFQVEGERMRIDWSKLADIGPLGFGVSVFPWGRELIVLAAAWVLVLPRRPRWGPAAAGAVLLLAGLVLVRYAGRDPLDVQRVGVWLGIILALVGLIVAGRKPADRNENIPTGQ